MFCMNNYFVWATPSSRFAVVDLKVPNLYNALSKYCSQLMFPQERCGSCIQVIENESKVKNYFVWRTPSSRFAVVDLSVRSQKTTVCFHPLPLSLLPPPTHIHYNKPSANKHSIYSTADMNSPTVRHKFTCNWRGYLQIFWTGVKRKPSSEILIISCSSRHASKKYLYLSCSNKFFSSCEARGWLLQ